MDTFWLFVHLSGTDANAIKGINPPTDEQWYLEYANYCDESGITADATNVIAISISQDGDDTNAKAVTTVSTDSDLTATAVGTSLVAQTVYAFTMVSDQSKRTFTSLLRPVVKVTKGGTGPAYNLCIGMRFRRRPVS